MPISFFWFWLQHPLGPAFFISQIHQSYLKSTKSEVELGQTYLFAIKFSLASKVNEVGCLHPSCAFQEHLSRSFRCCFLITPKLLMKKLTFLFIVLSSVSTSAQDVFFKTGLNSTLFNFKDQNGVKLTSLLPEMGNSYQLGVGLPLLDEFLRYELGFTLDTYNSTNEDPFNQYSWNTNYGGIKNSLGIYPLVDELTLGLVANLGFSKLLSGTQQINTSKYSLTTHPEFNGLMVQPGLGLDISYNLLNEIYLSFQYDYSKTLRFRNTQEERLSFTTNRILFGIHILID